MADRTKSISKNRFKCPKSPRKSVFKNYQKQKDKQFLENSKKKLAPNIEIQRDFSNAVFLHALILMYVLFTSLQVSIRE